MMKIFKYLLVANVYKETKHSMAMVLIAAVIVVLSIFIGNDLIDASDGSMKYLVLLCKWVVVLTTLTVMISHMSKIWKSFLSSVPIVGESLSKSRSDLHDKIMTKPELKSRSDLIIDKYKEKR